MVDAKNLSEKIMKRLEDYLPVEGCGTFYSEHIVPVIEDALFEVQTEFMGVTLPPQLLEAFKDGQNKAYEAAAKIVDDHESGKELCAEGVAERIRKLGNKK